MIVRERFLIFAIIGSTVYCEEQNPQFTEAEPELSNSVRDKFDEREIFTGLQYEDPTTTILKKKCEKNAKENPFAAGQDPFEEFKECGDRYTNKQVLFDGFKKHTGGAISTFCAKTSQLKECSKRLAARLWPCLSTSERPYVDNMLEAESQLLEYVCYNNGHRHKRFMNEGGPACIMLHIIEQDERITEILDMVERFELTVANITADDNLFERPDVKELCPKIVGLKERVVRELGRCEQDHPAQYVDAVLNIILRGTPCKNLVPPDRPSALAMMGAVAGAVLVVVVVAHGFCWCWRRRAGSGVKRDAAGGSGALKLLQ